MLCLDKSYSKFYEQKYAHIVSIFGHDTLNFYNHINKNL